MTRNSTNPTIRKFTTSPKKVPIAIVAPLSVWMFHASKFAPPKIRPMRRR
jgi:hypothetical protein